MAGDDLDDDYAPDDLIAESGDDESPENLAPLHGEEDQFFIDDEVDSHDSSTTKVWPTLDPVPTKNAKTAEEDEASREKKRKRRQKDNERKAKKQRLTLVDENRPDDTTVTASQSPADVAELLKRGQKQVMSKMTDVELEDIQIPESCITDTREWSGERTHENLAAFIRQVAPTLAARIGQTSKNNGAPTCIVLASNALRVTDLTRSIRPLRAEKGGEVCKLFARHFKLHEHAEHLKQTKIGVAVGTPGRIYALLNETDSLILKALSHIILDVTYMDLKKRSILDLLETKQEIFKNFFTHPPDFQCDMIIYNA